jgi:nitrate/nitrite-specific signal transduction histidine kinase
MLRRKLILILGCLTVLLLGMAIASLWPLQRVVSQMDHIATQASRILEQSNELNRSVSAIEVELHQLQAGRQHRMDRLIEQVEQLEQTADHVGDHYVMQEPDIQPTYRRFLQRVARFKQHVGTLATAQDPQLANRHSIEALGAAAQMRNDILLLVRYAHRHVQQEQQALSSNFRWLVIGIAIGFLLVINLTVMMLLRVASLILQPVDKLVEASRQLAMERFDHRVEVGQNDEFGELARAYNRLAEQLEHNEQRRLETLKQMALTLNHELNNAMAVIDLQLRLLRRTADRDEGSGRCLMQIHQSLQRMAGVVESIKHIRRIVLTDYTDGVKMLDLARSVGDEDDPAEAEASCSANRQSTQPR